MTHEEEIAELLMQWEEAWEHGDDLRVETLCADCPENKDMVLGRIRALKAMSWVKEEGVDDRALDPASDDNDVSFPKILGGRYQVEGLIGEGGYGRVYKAYDPELQRHVAIKIPRPKSGFSPDFADVLLEEARKVARLRHCGIVSVHDVGRFDDSVFVVSDLIDGENLADRLARGTPTADEAVLLVAEIADALNFAHDLGFVHRDIKPANILVDREGKPLITDFGIAARLDDLCRGKKLSTGTMPYAAPEQLAGELQLVDRRTDIYSLGVVFYEMLTGRSPYPARTPTTLREQILFRSPVSLQTVQPGISPVLERICLGCLAKHPADRYSSALEIARELRSTLSGETHRWR
jgi:serine/threonine protein kinase